MKSLALNAVILYILFKTPVSELILAKLPSYLRNLKSFKELWDSVIGLAGRGRRLSKRLSIVILFVAGAWLMKKIWEHLQGTEFASSFVEKYLCNKTVMGYSVCGTNRSREVLGDRRGF